MMDIRQRVPEISRIERLSKELQPFAQIRLLEEIHFKGERFPVHALIFDQTGDRQSPVLAFFGGVHGVERIGTQVILAYLETLSALLSWDELTRDLLKTVRLVFMPLVNPTGVFLRTRANSNGVDLMRNAPVDSTEALSPLRLYRGHRISPALPWYRGSANLMEPEGRAVEKLIREEIFPARVSICLDVHSGFGTIDRIWFPYAKTKAAFPGLPEVFRLRKLLDSALPNHVYRVEPQSTQYTTHGDLWDYFYEQHRKETQGRQVMLPLTLEMGSWQWVRKNPLQIFSKLGLYHPIKPHRVRRVLRRHLSFFDFLVRAVNSYESWAFLDAEHRLKHQKEALRTYWPTIAQ